MADIVKANKELPWKPVQHKRKPRCVAGRREGECSLVGGSAYADLVVSGVRASGDAKQTLSDYCKRGGIEIYEDSGITLLSKEPANRRTFSFKLTVKREFAEKMLDATFWPPFIYITKFVPSQRL